MLTRQGLSWESSETSDIFQGCRDALQGTEQTIKTKCQKHEEEHDGPEGCTWHLINGVCECYEDQSWATGCLLDDVKECTDELKATNPLPLDKVYFCFHFYPDRVLSIFRLAVVRRHWFDWHARPAQTLPTLLAKNINSVGSNMLGAFE